MPGNLLFRRWVDERGRLLLVTLALACAVVTAALGAVRPDAWVSLLLFGALSFLAGGRTLAGGARGLNLAPELRLGVTGVRAAAVQFGSFVGAAVGGVALALGGFTAAGLAFAACSRLRPCRTCARLRWPREGRRARTRRLRAANPRARGEPLAARRPFVRDAGPRGAGRRKLVRTPFQRDRDRIVHSKPFRRLKGKTQVFIDPEGDHYRTRMTHTLETSAISRVVARALRLNEDLVEAIGLGHDMGHTPFGHAGEEALDEALHEQCGRHFRHNEHSLVIARRLNLTHEVCDGILTHTGDQEPETLEGKIVRIVDRVAYINHDIDDAIRFGLLSEDDLPREEIELLGPTGSKRIDRLVRDLVDTSAEAGDIVQSPEVGEAMLSLRSFMFERVYLGPQVEDEHRRAHDVVRRDLRPPDRAR